MSFITGLMNLGRKANIAKGSVVAAKDIMKGKFNITNVADMAGVSKLLRSPEADKFVLSAKKQNAEILSDVIYKNDGGFLYRVIAKKLPSGTTVSHVYPAKELRNSPLLGKQIIKPNGTVTTSKSARDLNGSMKNSVHVVDHKTGQNFLSLHGEGLEYVNHGCSGVTSELQDILKKTVNV